jgi:hypothetical protein
MLKFFLCVPCAEDTNNGALSTAGVPETIDRGGGCTYCPVRGGEDREGPTFALLALETQRKRGTPLEGLRFSSLPSGHLRVTRRERHAQGTILQEAQGPEVLPSTESWASVAKQWARVDELLSAAFWMYWLMASTAPLLPSRRLTEAAPPHREQQRSLALGSVKPETYLWLQADPSLLQSRGERASWAGAQTGPARPPQR